MYSNILVPIDGSATSTRGLREAIKVAREQGSHLRVFHIVEKHVLDKEYCPGTYEGDAVEELREKGENALLEAETLVRNAGLAPESLMQEFSSRSAAEAILTQAKQWPADLIIMGTHGRRGIRRLALGSDAECVVRDATVPVLLVREPENLIDRNFEPEKTS